MKIPPYLCPKLLKHCAKWKTRQLSLDDLEWEIDFAELQLSEQIGTGEYGVVWLSKWQGRAVAVKQLRAANVKSNAFEEFLQVCMCGGFFLLLLSFISLFFYVVFIIIYLFTILFVYFNPIILMIYYSYFFFFSAFIVVNFLRFYFLILNETSLFGGTVAIPLLRTSYEKVNTSIPVLLFFNLILSPLILTTRIILFFFFSPFLYKFYIFFVFIFVIFFRMIIK